ncbi:hypothetical protein ACFC3Z_11750 [Enterococcus thailandicus]|uniref:hypothetical protein n=1 Tax=Enterococcus thailandicus TaxID=417368 RepID=UPI0035DF3406
MKSLLKTSLLTALFIVTVTGPVAYAQVNDTTAHPVATTLEEQTEIKEGTSGVLAGQMVPYIQGLPFTGTQTLHYTVKNTDFIKGDNAAILLQLPEEFTQITHLPNFLTFISGNVSYSSIFGYEEAKLTTEIMDVSDNRVIVHLPNTFWKGETGELDEGTISLNFVLSYGQILAERPDVTIPDTLIGYKFQAKLKYSAQEWDEQTEPLNATVEETYITSDTSAIVK